MDLFTWTTESTMIAMTEAQASTLRHLHAATTLEDPEDFDGWLRRAGADHDRDRTDDIVLYVEHRAGEESRRFEDGWYLMSADGRVEPLLEQWPPPPVSATLAPYQLGQLMWLWEDDPEGKEAGRTWEEWLSHRQAHRTYEHGHMVRLRFLPGLHTADVTNMREEMWVVVSEDGDWDESLDQEGREPRSFGFEGER
jgi:hypothetical protein